MRTWVIVALLLLPMPALAASFDCAKAATPVEHAICGTPALSKLDERMAFAVQRNSLIFGDGSRQGGPVLAEVATMQQQWIAERDKCGNRVDCLTRAYTEQLAVVEFHGRPGKQAWADKVAGLYQHEGWANLWMQVRDDNSVRISVATLRPDTSARCSYVGLGGPEGKTVKAGPLEIVLDGNLANIAPSEPNLRVNRESCRMGGSLIWRYVRR